jgi:tetratricopeptide (TPR) repeat protein
MKKLFLIALVFLFSVNIFAQTKEVADAIKAYEKVKEESQHPKKGLNPATWIKLSDALTGVYDAPIKSIWPGASRIDLKVLLKDQRIISTEERKYQDQTYTVDIYPDKELLYSQDGKLVSWKLTKEYLAVDLLGDAVKALEKAAELDTKSSKTKEISDKLLALKNRYQNEAMSAYTMGDYKKASVSFEASAAISANKLVNQIDTVITYYAGLTASMNKDPQRAIKFFKMTLDNGYDAKGDAYSYLAEAYKAEKNMDKAKEALENGFSKYPTNQSILVSLINAYLESNDDPNKILDLIKKAQENEPGNASLYYAEGNVWKNLNEMEKALACYNKSIETDSNYYFGSFAIGAAYYDKAVDIQTKATDEMDDAKYEALVKQLEENLEAAIKPFENCFSVCPDPEIKAVVAEYLKNIYFRFREKSEEFKANYEKYNNYVENSKKQ